MFDEIGEVMRVPSQVAFLIPSDAVDLALGLSGVLVGGTM